MSPAVTLGLIRTAAEIQAHQEGEERAPNANPILPYEVRVRRGVGDTVFLIGHDRRGEPMVELRIRKKHLRANSVKRMERWCREHDDEPGLALV